MVLDEIWSYKIGFVIKNGSLRVERRKKERPWVQIPLVTF